ncbi:MAG: TetR family transcriptional regulator [Caldithrix sp.]|nr:TetR family transcriptional regulator [Caldithrix sp.]
MSLTGELTPLQKKRRERILHAAAYQFADVDFQQADLSVIAREAGVGKATLYRYFKNKQDLYIRTIEYQLQKALDYIQEQAAKENDPVRYIETIIDSAVNYFENNPRTFRIVLLSNMARFDEIVELVAATRKRYYERMRHIFSRAVHDGVFRPIKTDIAMRIIDSAILHLMYEYHKTNTFSPEELKHELKNTLLHGFRK